MVYILMFSRNSFVSFSEFKWKRVHDDWLSGI